MSLYTVRFTTLREVTRYDAKRKPIETSRVDVEVVIRNLPKSTALGYQNCDNFTMEREIQSVSGERGKFRKRELPVFNDDTPRRAPQRDVPHTRPQAKRSNAAATGDLSAAINS